MKEGFDIRKSKVFHRRLDYKYPVITHGKGVYLFDENGKRYIDAVGGALVANIGHGHKDLAKKIGGFASKLNFLHGAQFTTREMEVYAKELCALAPKGLDKVYLVGGGGSDAVETAIKLARQYHWDSGNKNKFKIVFTRPSFHGATIGAMSVTGKEGPKNAQKPYLQNFPWFWGYSSYRCPHNKKNDSCTSECAFELERVIKKNGADKISALIIEPVVGASGGALLPPKGYFENIQKICKKHNVLLIIDEVMTGFGRTGKWFASEHFKIKPDILITAKGISGGYVPLSAVLATKKIYETIKNGSGSFIHGFTFVNNPLLSAVGKIVLDYIKKNDLIKNSEKQGEYLLSKLQDFKKFRTVGDVRGLGLMTAVEFVKDKKNKIPFPRKTHLAEKLLKTAQNKGLILYFCTAFVDDINGDAVMVAPPLNVTRKEIDEMVRIFGETIMEVESSI